MAKRTEPRAEPAFPRAHLILASAIALATALPMLFWPSKDVAAGSDTDAMTGRTRVIELPLGKNNAPAAQQAAQQAEGRQQAQAAAPAQVQVAPAADAETSVALLDTSAAARTNDASRQATGTADTQTPAASALSPETNTTGTDWVHTEIRRGDNLSLALARLGIGSREVHELVHADKLGREFLRLRPGETISLRKTAEGRVGELLYRRNRLESLHVARNAEGLQYQHQQREPERMTTHAVGTINNSLFVDASAAGLSDNMIMKLAELFGWDIDFALDIRKGDSFSLLYEERFLDGEKVGDGDILAARFYNRGETFTAIRYTDSKGETGYYAPDGSSVRKAFIRTPVPLARVSSRFNLNRRHPILHTVRAHKGVDYAASRGTPIKATGDGKVIHAGRKGGYGRTVIIQHGATYSTLYAHMNGYQRGIRRGARVKQGQVIGYIGSSGLATGPHLHYEFRVNGVHRNPLTVRFPAADPIPDSERKRFESASSTLLAKLDDLTGDALQLALNE